MDPHEELAQRLWNRVGTSQVISWAGLATICRALPEQACRDILNWRSAALILNALRNPDADLSSL